ncbi:hypothetical protein KUCAC02_016026, partial [Chaenocephalus aceratus]
MSLPSPLRNICPSNVAAAPLSPREVACPAQDGQVCASVIKRPSCAVTSGTEAGVIHDPVSAPSEGQTQTLTGQLRLLHMPWKKSASPVSERLDGPAALPAFKCQRASRSCHGTAATREELPSQSSLLPTRHLHSTDDNEMSSLINQGGEGEIKLGVGPKPSIWGQAWSCDRLDPGGRQQRQS